MISDVEEERKRCAGIAQGLAIALQMGAGTIHSEHFREGALAAAQWIHDEIIGTYGSIDKAPHS
jgi:hypothetical protein